MADEDNTAAGATGGTGSTSATSAAAQTDIQREVKTAKTAAADPVPEAVADTGGQMVEMCGEAGEPLGFVVSLSPGAADDNREDLAKRITGWSHFEVDGKPYTFSEYNALALLNRFPHFDKQLRDA